MESYKSRFRSTKTQQKLIKILWSTEYCGICFERSEDLCLVTTDIVIVLNGELISLLLKELITNVFNDVNIPFGPYICQECSNRIIQWFIFTCNTMQTVNFLCYYLNDFSCKVDDLESKIDSYIKDDISKAILVIEDKTGTNNNETKLRVEGLDIKTIDKVEPYLEYSKHQLKMNLCPLPSTKIKKHVVNRPSKKVLNRLSDTKSGMIKRKSGYECVKCSKVFTRFNLWKAHERNKHKQPTPKCKICSKTFDSHNTLIEHYKLHSKLKCRICNLLVPDTELNEHLQLNHEDDTYPCQYCNLVYYTAPALVVHLKISHPVENQLEDNLNPQCLLCLQYFDKSQLKKHKCKGRCPDCEEIFCVHYKYLVSFTEQKLNHTYKVKCKDCDYVCRKKEVLIIHVNREHLDHHPFSCDFCGTKFLSKLQLKRHILNIHMDKLTCQFCDKEFTRHATFKKHVAGCQLKSREFTCTQCPASFDSSVDLATHEKLKHSSDNFPCDKCNRIFLSKLNLVSHRNRSHRDIQITRRRQVWLCGLCDKTFHTRGECIQHRTTHDPKDKYMCRICNTQFANIKYLRWHNRMHKVKKETFPEKCTTCGKQVKSLRKHMQTHQLSNKSPSFVCEQCGKTFLTSTLLKSHGLVHLERVSCEICKKMIKPSTLIHHKRWHVQKKNGLLQKKIKKKDTKVRKCLAKCEYCDLSVIQDRLEAHVNRHHLNIRPYVCDICEDSFSAKYYLKMHMRVHSDEKKFTCEICNNKFRFKFCLKKHMLLHTGEKPFVCDVCGEGFTGSSSLKEHRLKHFEKTVACPLCFVMFHSIRNMRQHFKKQHWKQRCGKFNPKELVSEEYHYLFEDRRKVIIDT
ncbi:zinc finger protein 234-like [Pectinophora gossypiella]|uniref:zinc finger protein 234-like n=1 Tax=Pectinophora gossypiella TaxID=13191 RepID=UPI00214F3B9F|nr:zinc finger protein 234-like [Pectinophora gossypiella]